MARGCTGKISYQTRADAVTARKGIIARIRSDDPLKVYACHACQGFHLGRSPRDGPIKQLRKVEDYRKDSYRNRFARWMELVK